MSSASSSRITTSIDYESVDEIIGVEDLEECDISTELPVFRTSTSKSSSITLVSSPQSVSFDESSIICPVPLEKATLEAYQEVNHPIASTSNLNTRTKSNRSRSTTTSSWSSSDSTEFTSITPLSETNFPSSIPRIAYSDWQKFGIELYKPKPQKIKTKEMYYEYHSIKIKSSSDLVDRPKNERSNSQPTPKSKFKHQNQHQTNSHQSKSIFNSNQESNKPILLLRRATLEGYYCPDL
ncbi:hypothetical protein DFH28DRAFT_1085781 [Melampsora americana]|nr:hypothetical protein DFH28DRAFT_1085781 [Melampsora americana]